MLAAATDRAVLLFDVVQVVLIIFSKQTHLLSRTGPVQLLQCGRVRERLAKIRIWLALALADKHWLFCNLFPTIKVFLSFFIFRWRCLWVRLPSQPQMGAGLLQGTSNNLHNSSPFRITLIGDDWLEIMEKTSLQNQVWSSVHLAPTWPAEQRYNTGLNTFKTFSYSLTFKNMRSFKNTFLCRKRMFSRTSLTPRRLDWENNKILHQNKTRTYKSCVNNRHSYNNICEHEYISDSDTWLLRPSTLQLSTWGQKCPQIPQKWPKCFTKNYISAPSKRIMGSIYTTIPTLGTPRQGHVFQKNGPEVNQQLG